MALLVRKHLRRTLAAKSAPDSVDISGDAGRYIDPRDIDDPVTKTADALNENKFGKPSYRDLVTAAIA